MARVIRGALALAGVLAACGDASPTLGPTIRIGWDHGAWSVSQQETIRGELAALAALGPRFVEAGPGAGAWDVYVAAVVEPSLPQTVGYEVVGSRVVQINLAAIATYDVLAAAVGHEIGHALGMRHVCGSPDPARGCIGPVFGTGAMMNPIVFQSAPTAADVREFRRANPGWQP